MRQAKSLILTPQELRLKQFMRILFFFYTGALFLYLLPPMITIPGFLQPYPFLNDAAFGNNSTIKMGLFAVLCFIAAGDIRKYIVIVEVIILVMLLAMVSGLLLFCFARNNYIMHTGNRDLPIRTMILYSTIFDTAINIALIILYRAAQRGRYSLAYFTPLQFRTLTALAEVVIDGEKELLKPRDIAHNVDRYMGSFLGKSKWVTRLAVLGIEIYPLFFLKPPASCMRPEDRKAFLEKHFYQDVTLRLAPPFLRMLVQAMIRMGKQLCFMGYYNDPRVFESIGYTRFSERKDKAERISKFPIPPRKNLKVLHEKDVPEDSLTADVIIVGSGPGASILAKGLIEKNHRSVLIVEKGNYVDPAQFNEDEIDMVSHLYADGALQLASDFRFQVIQGSCVGGSSVVNNAVCFDTPENILAKWNDQNGLNACLDLDRYRQCNTNINSTVGVQKVPSLTIPEYLNPGGKKFMEGIHKMGLDLPPNITGSVAANIHACLGCGYCNIGCAYGKKLSMLDTILPDTQANAPKDGLRILAACEAWKIKSRGGSVSSIIAQFPSGRKIELKAHTYVISAGAVSSSILLQRSGIAVGKAGQHLAFNMGSPITAVFPDIINAYDGLQISHFLEPGPDRGYVFETWFNPPMFQSTVMPGWWDDHYRNMHRYNRMACTGVLVPSESNARVRIAGLTHREIRYEPTKNDFETLLKGLVLAGEIYLEAGAECVMPNTFNYYEFRTRAELGRLAQIIKDNSDITLGTGHPQGGNPMSGTPSKGVVDPEFKVYGYDNLYVCDASVFPSSIGVNPQITVMSLADYAVKSVK
jgi:choline dehydrogenase-like flavoprotein